MRPPNASGCLTLMYQNMKRKDIKKKENKRTLFPCSTIENSTRLSKGNIISNDIFIYLCPMFQKNARKVIKHCVHIFLCHILKMGRISKDFKDFTAFNEVHTTLLSSFTYLSTLLKNNRKIYQRKKSMFFPSFDIICSNVHIFNLEKDSN